jgi:type I restriction-modification system DNA methylase subunit
VSLLTTEATAAYTYRTTDVILFYALKRRKAQKQRSFRAKSTYGHCIKDEVLIDQTCGSGGFFYKGYNFVELYNPSADVLLFVRASNAEIYAMRLSYVAL